jgi:hypothetical protein
MNDELYAEILKDFKESFDMFPGVMGIKLSQNMIRVLAKDDINVEEFPATYMHKHGHMGISMLKESEKIKLDELNEKHDWN